MYQSHIVHSGAMTRLSYEVNILINCWNVEVSTNKIIIIGTSGDPVDSVPVHPNKNDIA